MLTTSISSQLPPSISLVSPPEHTPTFFISPVSIVPAAPVDSAAVDPVPVELVPVEPVQTALVPMEPCVSEETIENEVSSPSEISGDSIPQEDETSLSQENDVKPVTSKVLHPGGFGSRSSAFVPYVNLNNLIPQHPETVIPSYAPEPLYIPPTSNITAPVQMFSSVGLDNEANKSNINNINNNNIESAAADMTPASVLSQYFMQQSQVRFNSFTRNAPCLPFVRRIHLG